MVESRTTRRGFLAGAVVTVGAVQVHGTRASQEETTTGESQETTTTTVSAGEGQVREPGDSPEVQWGQFQADAANTGYVPNKSGPVNGVSEQWTFSTNAPIRSSPAVGHGAVFVGSNCGNTFRVAADTGEQEWRAPTGMVNNGVALQGDRVYVAAQPNPEDEETVQTTRQDGGQPKHLRSVFAGNGVEVWNVDIGGQSVSSPTILDGILYVSGDTVYGINVSSGATVWQNYPFPNNYVPDNWDYHNVERMEEGSVPCVTQRGVFVSARLRIYNDVGATTGALKPKTGENRSGLSRRYSPHGVTVSQRTAVTHEGDVTVARQASNAANRWEFRTGPLGASPAVTNETVYAGSLDQKLYALNLNNGELRWLFPADGSIRTAPVVTSDTVYFGTDNGTVFAVNTENGQPRWRFNANGSVRGDPVLANGTLYVGTDNGELHALGEN